MSRRTDPLERIARGHGCLGRDAAGRFRFKSTQKAHRFAEHLPTGYVGWISGAGNPVYQHEHTVRVESG